MTDLNLAGESQLYRSALIAIRQRAGQQKDASIEGAAGVLLAAVDKLGRSQVAKEVRALGKIEMRAAADGVPTKIGGYAAMFNSPTMIGGMFNETIMPGAFSAAIGRDDVRALFNHDPNFVIGRTTNNTLSLSEDATGLKFEAMPPDTAWAKDLMTSIARGDVSQCSFGFSVTKEMWDDTVEPPLRTVMEVELFDVSPVTYPAYEDTSCALRSLETTRSAKKQAEDAAAAEVARRAAEKTAADAAAAEADRVAKIGAAPVIGAKLRMKHAMRARGSGARTAKPKAPMNPVMPSGPDMKDMAAGMTQMRSDMQSLSDDMLQQMDQMYTDMQACVTS